MPAPKRKNVKLLQEEAYDVKERLDRMSVHDPRYEEVQDEMVRKAQACGTEYREYLRWAGKNISWKGMRK